MKKPRNILLQKTGHMLACVSFLAFSASAQVARSVDGTGNNVANPSWGAAHADLIRWAPACYPDSMGSPAGSARPSPRVLSNVLFDQPNGINDRMALSDYTWVFGQFMDHDISITADGSDFFFIQVPRGDRHFDPFNTGAALIPMRRSLVTPGTGTAPGNPRQHSNEITSFIDASNVYGSSSARANWLRSFSGGKLKASPGNFLPWNTLDGTFSADVDPAAPPMDNALRNSDKHYVAGDVRANENPLLASLHTVFMREHNRLCDVLAQRNPTWNDEQLYQRARKTVGGIIQSITYGEWLPAMGVQLPAYTGYKSAVNPSIANEFGGAAFRLGHTLLNGTLRRLNPDGSTHPLGHLSLRDAFFNIQAINQTGGIDPFIKGMAEQTQQQFDARVLDDVRNFLFGMPGQGGLDLASINIQRGRDRGLPDYNLFRESLGMTRLSNWSEVVSDPLTVAKLDSIYGGVNDVDLWVGLLSEEGSADKLFGPTMQKAMVRQFQALRDGDRYFYLGDPALSEADRVVIKNTRFSDVLRRNTDVDIMQHNVFSSMPHNMVPLCTAVDTKADLTGKVSLADGRTLPGASVRLYGMDDDMPVVISNNTGKSIFLDIPTCDDYIVDAKVSGSASAGVTSYDIYLLGQHLLQLNPITDPMRLLAADANQSGSVSAFDMSNIRRVILELDSTFAGSPAWRMIAAGQTLPTGGDPLQFNWAKTAKIDRFAADTSLGLIAIKMGDVDNSYSLNNSPIAPRSSTPLLISTQSTKEKIYAVSFRQNQFVAGQYSLSLEGAGRILNIGKLNPEAYVLSSDGRQLSVVSLTAEEGTYLTIQLSAEADVADLKLRKTFQNLVFDAEGTPQGLQLLTESLSIVDAEAGFRPNLMSEQSTLVLPSDFELAGANLILTDALGRVVLKRPLTANSTVLSRADLPGGLQGALAYSVESKGEIAFSGILILQ